MIKVMYIANDAGLGGASYSLLDMLGAIKDKISPTVVIPSAGVIEEQLKQLQIDYYIVPFETDYSEIGAHTLTEVNNIFLDNYQAALSLQDIIQSKKIQMIHTNSSVSNVGIMAALIAGIPHVWHVRELMEEHFGCEFLDQDLKKELFGCTDKVISISDCVKRVYKQKYDIDAVRIYDGLDVNKYICRDFSLKKKKRFLLTGVISLQKGQLDAVKAVNEIVKEGTDVQLYIVGSGNYQYRWVLKKFIRKYGIESNVHILTFRADLGSLRENCLFSIISSRMEALGRVTIEAMLGGNIVLGANTGGTAEIIGEDFTRGYLYKQGDWKDLSRVMQYAMEASNDQNAVIQKTAQAYAIDNFRAEQYVAKIIKVYEDILQNQASPYARKKIKISNELKDRYDELKNLPADISHLTSQSDNKMYQLQEIMQRWLSVKLENVSFADVLRNRGFKSVAIYGMGYLGCSLYDELEGGDIKIEYVMDKDLTYADEVLNVVKLDERMPKVDAVVVTVMGDISDICRLINEKCNYQIISLTHILDWCEEGVAL